MGQGTETCTDRPTEVSVIRFVSRNRTVEEITPKKEIYTCQQRGCGKIFTNQDEYKTHEALEALKIRFICREPGCGEELSDPGSMWRHYQEWHNNETNVFICPYTNCGSFHATSTNLEEHIETSHRQPPALSTEPEVICFEGPENSMDEDPVQSTDNIYEKATRPVKMALQHQQQYESNAKKRTQLKNKELAREQGKRINENTVNKEECTEYSEYSGTNTKETLIETINFPIHENLLINAENFLSQYDDHSTNACTDPDTDPLSIDPRNDLKAEPKCRSDDSKVDRSPDREKILYIKGNVDDGDDDDDDDEEDEDDDDVSNTVGAKAEAKAQEHGVDLDKFGRIYGNNSEYEISQNGESLTTMENSKLENSMENTNSNCSDDEEYTPKKQRMSRYKHDMYECGVNSCGKRYKDISHYRHHQGTHKKLVANTVNSYASNKTPIRGKQGKASTVSFFLCKIPGCGAQLNNVTGLWKHYQVNHANSKLPLVQATKNEEAFRCKFPGCEIEFNTTMKLYKHCNDVHFNESANSTSANAKTANGSSFHYIKLFKDDATVQQANFKTELKTKHNVNVNDYTKNIDGQRLSPIVKKDAGR